MSLGLSRSLTPLAAASIAFGLFFGVFTRPAFAEPLSSHVLHSEQPTLAELKHDLDSTDRLAVLEAIHVGLTDAPDGSTYMWRRHNGKIAGSVRPTASFRDTAGQICRYMVFQLLLGEHLRQIEGIACRQFDKSWLLEG